MNSKHVTLGFTFVLLLITLASTAWAIDPKSAYEVCDRYPNGAQKDSCYKIANSGAFDPLANGICDSIKKVVISNTCLLTVRNQYFQQDTVRACARFLSTQSPDDPLFQSQAVQCLQAVAGHSFHSSQVQRCDVMPDRLDTIGCFIEAAY